MRWSGPPIESSASLATKKMRNKETPTSAQAATPSRFVSSIRQSLPARRPLDVSLNGRGPRGPEGTLVENLLVAQVLCQRTSQGICNLSSQSARVIFHPSVGDVQHSFSACGETVAALQIALPVLGIEVMASTVDLDHKIFIWINEVHACDEPSFITHDPLAYWQRKALAAEQLEEFCFQGALSWGRYGIPAFEDDAQNARSSMAASGCFL